MTPFIRHSIWAAALLTCSLAAQAETAPEAAVRKLMQPRVGSPIDAVTLEARLASVKTAP